MSADPALALQGAFVDAIKHCGSAAGDRVYDQPPPDAAYPYVTIGEGQTVADLADCYDGSESYVDVHIWSRAVGFPEAKRIADRIRGALSDADLDLDGHTLALLQIQDTRYLRDPDGLTSHVVLTFRALSQPAD